MQKFEGIQAMRGIAALSVVCGHAVIQRDNLGIDRSTALALLYTLQSGVDIFFVISGFIISTAAAEAGASSGRAAAAAFSFRRIVRIYPIYWVVLVAAILSTLRIVVGPNDLQDKLTLDIVLLGSLGNWFVPPAWTLAFEISFYAAMTGIIIITPRNVLPASVICVMALALCYLCNLPAPWIFGRPIALEFGFGILIAALVRNGARSFAAPLMFMAGALFGLGATLQSGPAPISETTRLLTFGTGAALLIYAIIVSELNGAAFPRWLQYLGAISYSLYIWHHLVLRWCASLGGTRYIQGAAQIPIWVAICVVIAALSYEYLERPLLRWAKPAWRPRAMDAVAARP